MFNIICFILLSQVVVWSIGSIVKLNTSPNTGKLRSTQSSLMASYMDSEADACKDFYQYACGNWDKNNPIPDSKEFWGNLHLAESTELQKIGNLLNTSTNQQTDNDAVRKAKDFYISCMNITKIDQHGKTPLIDYVNNLGDWPVLDENLTGDGPDWLNLLVEAHRLGIGIIFKSMVYDDMFNSSRYSLTVLYSTLAFENGKKFLEDGKELKAYKTLIGNVLNEFHVNNFTAYTITEEIVNFETELAKIVLASQPIGNFMDHLTATTIADLQKNYSSINWQHYYERLHHKNFTNTEQVLVLTINFIEKLDTLIKNTSKKTMFNFIMWKIVFLLGNNIGKEFRLFNDQYTAAVTNVQTIPPRNEKCLSETMEHFRDAVGSMYVQKYFSTDARADAKDLLSRLKNSFKVFIQDADWVTESEKNAAKLKLDKMGMEIGYPNYILDDSKLNAVYENIFIKSSDYFGNVINLLKFSSAQETKLLDKIVDKNNWPTSFMQQGSIYVFTKQKLFTTVMMFRPPLYHKDLPKFMNFGGVGTIMGHEIAHGFDSTGISFDHDGNGKEWFSNASKIEYTTRESCFIDKYSNYTLDGKNMNGTKVLAEAIADDVGIKLAYAAYMDWIQENKNSNALDHEKLDSFTLSNEKMFFISSAQLHCEAIRPSAWPDIWENEIHAVQKYRVNGVMSNSNDFAKAFDCNIGSVMNPAKKCTIW